MDLWVYGFMIYGYLYLWIYEYLDVWMYGFMDIWIYGCMDVWIYGYMDMYTHTHMFFSFFSGWGEGAEFFFSRMKTLQIRRG